MKKITLTFVLAFVCIFAANAQKFRVGLKAGVNFADANGIINDRSISSDTKMKASYHVGAVADISLVGFYIQPGIIVNSKGFKIKDGITNEEVKTNLTYLEIPVNVGYRLGLGPLKANFGVGPYVAFGLGGKTVGGGIDEAIKWGTGEGETKPTDWGINIGAGIEVSKFFGTVQYGLGLSNISNTVNSKFKNAVLSFSVGYYLFGL